MVPWYTCTIPLVWYTLLQHRYVHVCTYVPTVHVYVHVCTYVPMVHVYHGTVRTYVQWYAHVYLVPWYHWYVNAYSVRTCNVMSQLSDWKRAHMCTENHVCFGRIHGSQLREGANAGQHTPTLSLPRSHHCLDGEVYRGNRHYNVCEHVVHVYYVRTYTCTVYVCTIW